MDEVRWFIWVKSCGTGARRLDKSDVITSNWLSHLGMPGRELSSRKPADALKWTATEEQEKFAGFETTRWWKRDGDSPGIQVCSFSNARLFCLTFGKGRGGGGSSHLPTADNFSFFSPFKLWENVRLSAHISVKEGLVWDGGGGIYLCHFFL